MDHPLRALRAVNKVEEESVGMEKALAMVRDQAFTGMVWGQAQVMMKMENALMIMMSKVLVPIL